MPITNVDATQTVTPVAKKMLTTAAEFTHFLFQSYRLVNGAEYRKEGARKYLYLNGSGEYATTPARNFRDGSFTLASWVKLPNDENDNAPIYSSWPLGGSQFLFMAGHNGKVFFGAVNSDGGYKPLLETM